MISNRCARKSLVTNCNSIISKNYLRFLVDSNETFYLLIHAEEVCLLCVLHCKGTVYSMFYNIFYIKTNNSKTKERIIG